MMRRFPLDIFDFVKIPRCERAVSIQSGMCIEFLCIWCKIFHVCKTTYRQAAQRAESWLAWPNPICEFEEWKNGCWGWRRSWNIYTPLMVSSPVSLLFHKEPFFPRYHGKSKFISIVSLFCYKHDV